MVLLPDIYRGSLCRSLQIIARHRFRCFRPKHCPFPFLCSFRPFVTSAARFLPNYIYNYSRVGLAVHQQQLPGAREAYHRSTQQSPSLANRKNLDEQRRVLPLSHRWIFPRRPFRYLEMTNLSRGNLLFMEMFKGKRVGRTRVPRTWINFPIVCVLGRRTKSSRR